MNTKKEIRKIIAEHSAELKKGTKGYHSCERNIYLTDKDYLRVYIFGYGLEFSLHLGNSETLWMFYRDGSIYDLNNVWRKYKYRFEKYIVEAEECGKDKAFVAKLKELYSLL